MTGSKLAKHQKTRNLRQHERKESGTDKIYRATEKVKGRTGSWMRKLK
jgi:hypothetical protein